MNSVMEQKKVFSALTVNNTKEVFVSKVWNITKTKVKKKMFLGGKKQSGFANGLALFPPTGKKKACNDFSKIFVFNMILYREKN